MIDLVALKASLKTFAKFVIWFGVAAAIDAGLRNLNVIHGGAIVDSVLVPLLGAALKAAATYWATQRPQEV